MERLVPSSDTVPASVARFLLPFEHHVISVRQHPAVLIPRTLLVLLGLALAGWLSSSVAHGNSTTILVIWILWLLLVSWLVSKLISWWFYHFVVTTRRLVLATGLLVRRVNAIPLDKVTDIEFKQTPTGRLLGYGEFEVRSPAADLRMRNIRFIPYPGQLYLEVSGLIFKGESD